MAAEAFRVLQLKQFHELFLEKESRADGRKFTAFRDILLNYNSISSADGSCLVKLGNTTCIGGIKATLAEPDLASPKAGFLDVSVELPPISNVKFKENRQGTNDESQIAGFKLSEILKSASCLDLDRLCIEEGKKVWRLELEVICLDYDGNTNDAVLIAAIGALNCCSLPEVTLTGSDVVFGAQKSKLVIKDMPISSTFATFEKNVILADPNYDEETLATGLVTIVWNQSKQVLNSVTKDGGVAISEDRLLELIELSKSRSRKVLELFANPKSCS